jgi:DNA-binding Lrp family transcriptional regulator
MSTKEASKALNVPLSTVQRRVRLLVNAGILMMKMDVEYRLLGFKRGLLQIHLRNGGLKSLVEELSRIPGMLSVSVHVGSSDIVCSFIYRNSMQLLDVMSHTRDLKEVEKIIWSEEVFSVLTEDRVVDILPMVKENRQAGPPQKFGPATGSLTNDTSMSVH